VSDDNPFKPENRAKTLDTYGRASAIGGVMLVGVGWPLAAGKIRPGATLGLRTDKAMRDDATWYEANAVLGKDLIGAGLLIFVVAMVLRYKYRDRFNGQRIFYINTAVAFFAVLLALLHSAAALSAM